MAAKTSGKPGNASEKIDQLIAGLTDWRGRTFAAVRKAILDADREIVEEWKWMGSPVWSRDGIIAVANAHKGKVKLTFDHGARLPDPSGLFNAGLEGNQRRAIDFFEGDKVDARALKQLVRVAIAHNQERRKKTPAEGAKAAKGAGAAGKPALLSGGNPQIPKGYGDTPVQAYIAAMPGWKSEIGKRMDEIIVRAVPGVKKAVKWNSPFYGVEDDLWFLSFHVFTKYVKVTFFRGASLKPPPPGKSKYPDVRYLDIREGEFDETQFASWVKQASKLPGEKM